MIPARNEKTLIRLNLNLITGLTIEELESFFEVTGIRETRDYLKFFSFSCFEIFRFIFKFVPIIN